MDPKNIIISDSKIAFATLYISSDLLLIEAQHRILPVEFFLSSVNLDDLTPQWLPFLVETLPSQEKIFSLATSIT
jgi:hypothetical protein